MAALDRACFDAPFRFSLAMLRRLASASGTFTLVAIAPTGLLEGFVMVEAGEPAYLATLDVAPGARRSGLGTRLILAAEAHAATQGSITLALHVWTANEAAVRFYEARGYLRQRRERSFYASGFDAFVYAKHLRSDAS